jgi:hypothetical protein
MRTARDMGSKGVTWVCIFSTLLMGCYSSVVVEPNVSGTGQLYGARVDYIVMKDGIRFDYVKPPAIYEGKIVGQIVVVTEAVDTQKVSISTAPIVCTGMTDSATNEFLIDVYGKKYVFVEDPSAVSATASSKAVCPHTKLSSRDNVSIPLSEVAEVHGSKYDSAGTTTLVWVCAGVGVAAVITAIIVVAVNNMTIVNFGR